MTDITDTETKIAAVSEPLKLAAALLFHDSQGDNDTDLGFGVLQLLRAADMRFHLERRGVLSHQPIGDTALAIIRMLVRENDADQVRFWIETVEAEAANSAEWVPA